MEQQQDNHPQRGDYTRQNLAGKNSQELISIILSLQRQKKLGWKAFYRFRDRVGELIGRIQLIEDVPQQDNQPTEFFRTQYIQLIQQVRGLNDCPVCLETLTTENTHISNCGHLVCKGCYERISRPKKCPICRYNI